ncbi:hypothetical protein AMTRI_Chr11g158140 [Amborella trichopoda]|uniref:Protein kinase domain-containing protein n=1 Tax=Amborella trichopoda TaxID=13333 RepID=W1NVN4_AMBTC|nr:probable serine/threonine-protein kinase At1g54610 [Amborella trichopoda]XP_020519024.1 probable serine/threonine-protein kinase At1g54610 [Amborella trichopoda]XP_020519025.1 probable serine/threonine-protein kinase At1g54610 [Amborella trichopoda]ERM99657.1 hypothetical protein AMTR_s00099p00026630 [Amborella trichopoda]|eukprot:XP_006836804.1 probable serine/threonine-protein kinase At1g54610 [Amborella trichopoda]
MGCICSKASTTDDYIENRTEKNSSKSTARRSSTPSKREEVIVVDDGGTERESRVRLISKPEPVVVTPLSSEDGEKRVVEVPQKVHQRRATVDYGVNENHELRITNLPNHIEGEQVAAGWPSWLTAVAGEAIKGWIPRRADSFEKLHKIGQGTYSNVYKARDLETGKIVALKKVRFVNLDPESVRFMAREIHILRRLDHPNVVKLEGLVTSRMSCSLYLVLEYMEHDLAGLAANPGLKFTESQIKCYMQQLLHGLEHCHSRGVLHRDIKGSNLLIDNNGILRIADFGLATIFHPDQKQPMTSRVVTLWYRPPELLLGATEYGVAVDLWSTGCILAELLAGKPIMPGRTEVEQLHKIFKLCGSPSEGYWRKSKLPHATIFKPQHPYERCFVETFKEFPSSALVLLDSLLAIEPEDRGTASSALKSEFFTTKPFACDPSSLPKYPPSKEFDAKLRDEEARRQRAAGEKADSVSKASRESRAVPAPDANAELPSSVQKRQANSKPKSSSEKYNPQADDVGSGFLMEPPGGPAGGTAQNGFSHSGSLMHPNAYGSSWSKKPKEEEVRLAPNREGGGARDPNLRTQRSYMPQPVSNMSVFMGRRKTAKSDNHRERTTNQHWPEHRKLNQLEIDGPSDKSEWTHHLLDQPTTSKKDERMGNKDMPSGYAPKKNRIHYSGPLLPPSGNIDDLLKEHERQIQHAVRKARLDKVKTKKHQGEMTQLEALLFPGRNGSSDY